MSSGVNTIGFKEFQSKLKALPNNIMVKADSYVIDAAQKWAQRAAKDAPKDQGTINTTISWDKISVGVSEVSSPAQHSAFVEWGTRSRKRVPSELQSYANSLTYQKGNGSAKDFIFAWAKRVGIPKEGWYPVYRKIMTVGINPHPFFFIQKDAIKNELFAKLKQLVEKTQ